MNKSDFTVKVGYTGFDLLYKDKSIGGAGTLGTATRTSDGRVKSHQARRADLQMYKEQAERDIENIVAGRGHKYYLSAIKEIEGVAMNQAEIVIPSHKDYLDGKISHRDYYRTLGQAIGLTANDVPFGAEEICASKDEHFNDLPLAKWDAQHFNVMNKVKAAHRTEITGWSISKTVSCLKTIAQDIRDKGIDYVHQNPDAFPTKKTLNFGKIDYMGRGRKDCLVTVDVAMAAGKLSICGNVWNNLQTDTIAGGQNRQELFRHLRGNPYFREVNQIWKEWHLNDMHAGTPAQEAVLAKYEKADSKEPLGTDFPDKQKSHYDWACAVLAKENMLVDNGYKYGSAWLKVELPKEVIDTIHRWEPNMAVVEAGKYSGMILAVDQVGDRAVVTQKTGRDGQVVKHNQSLLDHKLKAGDVVDISYNKEGVGVVKGLEKAEIAR